MAKNKLDKDKAVQRNFTFADMRALDEDGVHRIEGHAAVYDETTIIGDMFKEVIVRGAFDDTDFSDVILSTNHDLKKIPLARSRRNNSNSTMQLNIDEMGLKVRADLDTDNNMDAKAVHGSVARGDMSGMSFIFYVSQERWEDLDKEMPTRFIEKIRKVREVSTVTFPAYDGTDINARDTLDNEKNALDNARSQTELDNSKELELLKLKNQIIAKG